MRSLIFAAATAATFGIAGPASAQTVYVDDGYRSGYSSSGGPGVELYVGAPRAGVYAYDESAPRYRHRRYDRDWNDGYAYDSGARYRYRGYSRDWDDGYRTGW